MDITEAYQEAIIQDALSTDDEEVQSDEEVTFKKEDLNAKKDDWKCSRDPKFAIALYPQNLSRAHRDKIKSNLSVPGIQERHENTLIKSFEMSPHLICL